MKRLLLMMGLISGWAAAKVSVVTSTTDLAWLVKQIGGEYVSVESLLRGTENPHYVDTVPNFIRAVADAQVVCSIGLELEVGWLPKVLAKSGNARVQPGGAGFCETGRGVAVLEKPTGPVDRSMGDVHPAGNPHYWLSPKSFAQAVPEIVAVLSTAEPAHAADFQKSADTVTRRLTDLEAKGVNRLKPLLSVAGALPVVEYHKEFSYFLAGYGVKSFGSIEEKPGVPPSAGRLLEVARGAQAAGVRLVLAAETSPRKTLEKFTELSKIPVLILPTSIRRGADYLTEHERAVTLVAEALSGPKG